MVVPFAAGAEQEGGEVMPLTPVTGHMVRRARLSHLQSALPPTSWTCSAWVSVGARMWWHCSSRQGAACALCIHSWRP